MAPSLAVAALFAFPISWSQYLLTLLIGSERVITLPVLLFSAASGGNPVTIAATARIQTSEVFETSNVSYPKTP